MSDLTTLNPGAGASPASASDLTPEAAQARMVELRHDSGWKARYAAGDSAARREFASLNATIAAGMGEHPDEHALAVSQGRVTGPQHHQPATATPAPRPPAADGTMTTAQAQARFNEMKVDKAFLARHAAGDAEARRELKQVNEAIARGMDGEDGAAGEAPAAGEVDPAAYRMPKLSDDVTKPGEMARVGEVDKFLRATLSSMSVPKESGDQLLAAGERFGTTWNAAPPEQRQAMNVREMAQVRAAWGDNFDANIGVVREAITAADLVNPGIARVLEASGVMNSAMMVQLVYQHAMRMRGARA